MAWQDRDDFMHRDRDLMGVQGDVLFADPLGVREASSRSQPSRGQHTAPRNDDRYTSAQTGAPQAGWSHHGSTSRADNDGMADLQREEEEQGPVASFFWYMFAGGKQCCSMRDRTKPHDLEAAKKAAETGRPPKSQFSEASPRGEGDRTPTKLHGNRERGLSPSAPSNARHESRETPTRKPEPAHAQQQRRQQGKADTDSDSDGERFRARKNKQNPPDPSPLSAWQRPQSDNGRNVPQLNSGSHSGPGGGARPHDALAAASEPSNNSVAAAHMPKRWEWPTWCLNFKEPCIEVYVVDDDTGKGKWVKAEPQSRVVDKSGRDAYLCVEYEWDGDYYIQDFGPQNVRKRGHEMTVFQMFEKNDLGGIDRKDTGAGISDFLDD